MAQPVTTKRTARSGWIARLVAVLVLAVQMLSALPAGAAGATGRVTLFAAASTTNAVDALAAALAGAAPPVLLTPVFAASSTLARQIEQGAPADLYLSADPAWMRYLAERGMVDPDRRVDLLGNRLVMIAPTGAAPVGLADVAALRARIGAGRLAMGDPDHVPAGRYGRAALRALGLWDGLRGLLAPAADVRVALALVGRGEAPLGIVYATDAAISDRVAVVAALPADSHSAVRYPLAAVAGRDRPAVAAAWRALTGPAARDHFAGFGFIWLPGAGG